MCVVLVQMIITVHAATGEDVHATCKRSLARPAQHEYLETDCRFANDDHSSGRSDRLDGRHAQSRLLEEPRRLKIFYLYCQSSYVVCLNSGRSGTEYEVEC